MKQSVFMLIWPEVAIDTVREVAVLGTDVVRSNL